MDLYKAAKGAYKDQESTAMKALIVYKFIVTLLIAFPLLYIAGFISGLLWFMNPHAAVKKLSTGYSRS